MEIIPPSAIHARSRRLDISQSCSGVLPRPHRSSARLQCQKRGKRDLAAKAAASVNSNYGSGGSSMVDSDMLVLRKRMHDLRTEEMNCIPPHWMEWEKGWYPSYCSDVCASLVEIQTMLLNTRPSIAIAVSTPIFSSVVVSLLLLLIQLSTSIRV